MFDHSDNDSDVRFHEKLKRTKSAKRANGPKRRSGGSKGKSSASPGGIRQRRNKRWNW